MEEASWEKHLGRGKYLKQSAQQAKAKRPALDAAENAAGEARRLPEIVQNQNSGTPKNEHFQIATELRCMKSQI